MRRIRAERIRRGWTHVELARRARVTQADLSRIECGRLLPGVRAPRLAAALGIQPEQLLEDAELVVVTTTSAGTR